MQVVLLKEKNRFFYTIKTYDDPSIRILAYFLTDDVGSSGKETFKKWVLEWHHQNEISSNATFSWKENNNIVLQLMWDEDTSITLTKEQYIYLMEKWYELLKIEPQEIIITLQEGKLTVEGHNPNAESLDC